jgi:predicted O-methyltransferase YrrM
MVKFEPKIPLVQALRKNFRLRGLRERDFAKDSLPHLCRDPQRDGKKNRGRTCLAKALGDMEVEKAVEIGVMRGGSAILWASCNPKLHLTCIDPYIETRRHKHYELAKTRLAGPQFELMRCTSMDGLKKFRDECLDFVHIDGGHDFDNVCMDIICWMKKLKVGGVMACHDYHDGFTFGVVEAIRAYTQAHHIDPWYVAEDPQPTAFWQKQR